MFKIGDTVEIYNDDSQDDFWIRYGYIGQVGKVRKILKNGVIQLLLDKQVTSMDTPCDGKYLCNVGPFNIRIYKQKRPNLYWR